MSLYTELRKRHVLEIALVYLGVAWLFIEITQFIVGNYGFSRKVLDAVFLVAALGFPAFIVIAWYHGERGSQNVRRSEVSLLLTLAVLAAIGTYRIATGEEAASADPGAAAVAPATGGLVSADGAIDLGRGSLAVLPFTNNVADEELAWLGSGLADLLTTNFAQVPDLRVVGRQSLYDLLTEEGRTESEEIPASLASTVARAAGAHAMLWGSISGTADDLVIDAQLIELETGTVIAGERVRGDDVFEMVDQLTDRLTRRVAGPRDLPQPVQLSRFGTEDLEALAAFQQGVAAERKGEPDVAAFHYERAAEIDSTFMLPTIRLAGGGERWSTVVPGDPTAGAFDVRVGEFADAEPGEFEFDPAEMDFEDLSPDQRRAVRARLRRDPEYARRTAEIHKERALRMMERLNVDIEDMGGELAAKMKGMSREDFIIMFDSTLSETLSSSVRVGRARPDTSGRRER